MLIKISYYDTLPVSGFAAHAIENKINFKKLF